MSKTNLFKAGLVLAFGLSASAFAQTESFCSTTTHSPSAQKKEVSRNEVGKVGNIGYELWDENGNGGGKAIFYDDGSMDCYITNAKDYLCRAGLSLGSTQTYDQLNGDMVAEFKLIKTPGNNVQYSYIGVYGWMENVPGAPNGLVEYYVLTIRFPSICRVTGSVIRSWATLLLMVLNILFTAIPVMVRPSRLAMVSSISISVSASRCATAVPSTFPST